MIASALEIILQKDVQSIFDTFSACFNVRIGFFSPEGREILTGQTLASNCRYCNMHQRKMFGREKCLELDEKMRVEARKADMLINYQCHGGLFEAVMPIRVGLAFLGYAMIGQIRNGATIPREITAAWKHRPQTLQRAFDELPLMQEKNIRHMLELFTITMRYIVSQNLITLQGNMLIDDALQYMREHLTSPISLREIMRHTHRSASTISHLFRQKFGKSFRQTLVEMQLEKAEEILRTNPDITIAEAARQVGYDDPYHFSTVYKKYRGFPPSKFRKRR